MKCQKCKGNFPEKKIEESHDVPCYLFEGNRKGRKNQADKYGRHHLCKKCHKEYEESLNSLFKLKAFEFAKRWFNG